MRPIPATRSHPPFPRLKDYGEEFVGGGLWGMKLLSGGSAAPQVGYRFYVAEHGETAGIEYAYSTSTTCWASPST